jgi:ring-1,2-phenylacetyl-CoA epoxidase subunit PaaD
MPTFLGCPAIGMMRGMIGERLAELGPVRVELVLDEAWTSERITEEGRRKLQESGFAPPPRGDLIELTVLPVAECPYCGSHDTTLDSPFGPTACRAIHYCRACRQPFEQFKAV